MVKQATKAAKKSARKKRGVKRAKGGAKLPTVRVRMYRQGLGDCFLITFNSEDEDLGNHRHILIDCGTLGNKSTNATMEQVADSIHEAIHDQLDVVVATHEHKDHLSGFNNKRLQELAGKVKEVWLAWTENPADKVAQSIAKYKQDLGSALAALAVTASGGETSDHIRDVLGFAGDVTLGADFAKTINNAMEFVRTELVGDPMYHEPGDVIRRDWLPGFRIYVLGPPKSEDFLRTLGEHGSDELYGVARGMENAALVHAAFMNKSALAADELAEFEQHAPFGRSLSGSGETARRRYYPQYFAFDDRWRSIENDWMNSGSELALQLDSLTNNTSLALAIERISDGKVLLFPADAQLGNWMSWQELKFDIDGREITASDLLARTVFYKTGHHASHNATARNIGLELMEESDIRAFIPVDRRVALTRNPKGSWQMPARPLYRRLLEKCRGRVVRADLGWAADAKDADDRKTEKEFLGLATEAEWKEWKTLQKADEDDGIVKTVNELYVEYVLRG